MKQESIIQDIAKKFNIDLPAIIPNEGRKQLAARINELIATDFDRLVSILYRMDVNEKKLKAVLAANPNENAGFLIADLMMERQLQKIKSRQEHRRDDNISEEEKW